MIYCSFLFSFYYHNIEKKKMKEEVKGMQSVVSGREIWYNITIKF